MREQSKKLVFYDIMENGTKLQGLCNVSSALNEEEYNKAIALINRGDVVGFEGVPGRSKRGELSIMAKRIVLLTPYVVLFARLWLLS